jgi:hypothetical protein
MIIITVKPVRAELIDFSVKDETAEMNIWFSDGNDEHRLALSRKILSPEELAEQMIVEMRRIVKKCHTPESDSYDEILVVNFENEDDAVKKLHRFFERVREKIKEVRQLRSAHGYLDTINRAKKFEMEL